MRANGFPHLIDAADHATALERLEVDGTELQEAELQELMHQNPSLLPIAKFDGGFGPLISLGREIMGIDNLFISPTGRLTVVEAKLWRNPQATRSVLAQVLDYASRLSKLNYEDLESACQAANQSALTAETGLYQLAASQSPEQVPSEADFVDHVQRDLRNGRFLLLVVGDGIREGLERVVDALHHQSRLHFTFGLVELELYREIESGRRLVVPRVVAHSTEIERAVVTVRGASSENLDVDVRSGPAEHTPKLTEQEFLVSIEDEQARQFGERLFQWARQRGRIEITKRGDSASVRIPFSSTSAGLILIRLFGDGRVLTTPPRLRQILRKSGVGDEEVIRIARELQRLFPGIQLHMERDRVVPTMSAADLLTRLSQVLSIYDNAVERLKAIDQDHEKDASGDDT